MALGMGGFRCEDVEIGGHRACAWYTLGHEHGTPTDMASSRIFSNASCPDKYPSPLRIDRSSKSYC